MKPTCVCPCGASRFALDGEPIGRRRVADVADDIPKISGYWASEAYVTRKVFGALFQSGSSS